MFFYSVRAGILWSATQGNFIGLLTITDFIRVILDQWDKLTPEQKSANSIQSHAWLSAIEEQTLEEWRATKSASSCVRMRPQQFTWISATDNIQTALETFSAKHIHRLPVIDPETGNVVSVLSHKRILKFFHMCLHSIFVSAGMTSGKADLTKEKSGSRSTSPSNQSSLPSFNHLTSGSLLSRKLSELNVGTYGDNVLTCHLEEMTADVLRKMVDAKVSALPVVEQDTGKIINVYARFDAIFLAADGSYANLGSPLSKAISKRPNRNLHTNVLTCSPDEPLGVVIDRFVSEQVHRLICIDSAGCPTGVVSLSDVLRCLAGLHNPPRPLLLLPSISADGSKMRQHGQQTEEPASAEEAV